MMKLFCSLVCAILFTACFNPKYEGLGVADGLFTSLQSDEFITIEVKPNLYTKKIVFREGATEEVRDGKSLSSIELVQLDYFIKSVNGRNPSNACSVYGSLIIIKNFADGTVRRYRGAFDGCNLDEQSILLDVLGDYDD